MTDRFYGTSVFSGRAMSHGKDAKRILTDKFYNALGLSRRARGLCIGHDEVKTSVKSGKAKLVILTADASERLENEIRSLTKDTQIIRTDASMNDMDAHIGKHSGIFSVTDDGLKNLILSTI